MEFVLKKWCPCSEQNMYINDLLQADWISTGSGLVTHWEQENSTLICSGDVRNISLWDLKSETKKQVCCLMGLCVCVCGVCVGGYVCMCVCMCVCIHVCSACECMCVYMCVYKCVCVSVHVCVYICVFSVYTCMCVCVCIHAYVCLCVIFKMRISTRLPDVYSFCS